MYIVRDRSRNGKAVSWGTDWTRMDEIAATNRDDFEVWPDLAANDYYWHVERQGFNWVHPYDREAQLYAEIKP